MYWLKALTIYPMVCTCVMCVVCLCYVWVCVCVHVLHVFFTGCFSRTAHVLFAKNLIALRSGRDVTKCRLEAAVLKLVSREGTFDIGFVIGTVSDVLDKKSSLLCHNIVCTVIL